MTTEAQESASGGFDALAAMETLLDEPAVPASRGDEGKVEKEAVVKDEGSGEVAETTDDPSDDLDASDVGAENEEPETDDSGETDEEETDEGAAAEVSLETEVELSDGSKVSIKEAVEGYLRTQDYTAKTREVSEQRQKVEERAREFVEYGQQLQQERVFLQQFAQQWLPKAPDKSLMQTDPIGYMEAKEAYDEAMASFNALQQQTAAQQARYQAEQARQVQEYARAEQAKLLEARPELRDPQKAQKIKADLVKTFTSTYGFAPDEFANIADSRVVRVMLDAMEYHKAKASIPQAKAKAAGKPAPMRSGQRSQPSDRAARERAAKLGKFTKNPNTQNAVDLLIDFNLV